MDDYAHHPTEIKATMEALRNNNKDKRIIVIFQPHRYTRTRILHEKFGPVFKYADIVRLMEIYPAGEKPIKGVSSGLLLSGISKYCRDIKIFNPETDLNNFVKMLVPGDMVLSLGAGDVWKINEEVLARWKRFCQKK